MPEWDRAVRMARLPAEKCRRRNRHQNPCQSAQNKTGLCGNLQRCEMAEGVEAAAKARNDQRLAMVETGIATRWTSLRLPLDPA